MKKELLKHLSLDFCNNSCGKEKRIDCDTKGMTCAFLAMFLCDCNKYTEPIDDEKLEELAEENTHEKYYYTGDTKGVEDFQLGFKAGYRAAKQE